MYGELDTLRRSQSSTNFFQDNIQRLGFEPVINYNEVSGIDSRLVSLKSKELEELINRLKCIICYNIPFTPLECLGCSAVFCENCYKKSKSNRNVCPQCKVFEFKTKKLFLADSVYKYISIKCTNKGCTVTTKFSEYKNHLIHCPYRQYKCANEKCKYVGTLNEMSIHIPQCPYLIKKCYYCGKEIYKKDLELHESNAECLKIRNKQAKLELEKLKKDYKTKYNELKEKYKAEKKSREDFENKYNEFSKKYNSEKTAKEDFENRYNSLSKKYNYEVKRREEFETQVNTLQKERQETITDFKELYNKLLKKQIPPPSPKPAINTENILNNINYSSRYTFTEYRNKENDFNTFSNSRSNFYKKKLTIKNTKNS